MQNGYVKLYRSILDWDWFQDSNAFKIFIYCLLSANHEQKKWQGIIIEPGQFITSYEKLAKSTGLTVRQIRTVLNKLKTTGELTHKTTSRYSIITVNNWDCYQQNDKQIDRQATSKRQTDDKQATTNKNEKNEKNERNNFISFSENSKFLNCDLMFDSNVNKVFEIYEKLCTALVPLRFERRDLELRQAIKDFLIFTDFNFDYFSEVCQKANEQVFLLENKIDLKSLIKNHSRIYSGFFAKGKSTTKKAVKSSSTAEIVAKVKARMEDDQ